MAIIHRATITPTKQEILDGIHGGPVEIVGNYRFDDPDGEVGVEGFVVRRRDDLQHTVLTYRGAPLDDAGASQVCTMEHSTLGRRWVYDGTTDPVAVECFRQALLGQQEQAVMEVWADGEQVSTRESTARLTLVPGTATGQETVWIAGALGGADGFDGPTLAASWAGGEATIAGLESRGSDRGVGLEPP